MATLGSTAQALGNPMTNMTWADIYSRLKEAPKGKLWGVPRGGAIVAGLTGRAVDSIDQADAIVDDIVDSGATRDRYSVYNKPFWALVEKQPDMGWVRFPWEETDPSKDMEDTVRRQLEYIGEDPNREGLKDTPKRVIKALTEMTQGYRANIGDILKTTFDIQYDQVVVLRDITFTSLCEHHLLPFTGEACVGYLPGERILGLSKLARLVHAFASRLQVQERLTTQVAQALVDALNPRGVAVVMKAAHMCMQCRGVRQQGAEMVTSAMVGKFRESPELRAEFMALATQRHI